LRTLVDTSFLIRVAELGADLLARVEEKLNTKIVPVVIPNVIEELRSLAKGRGVKAKRAGLAIKATRCERKGGRRGPRPNQSC
jgi:rRNA-processing protein FCF1